MATMSKYENIMWEKEMKEKIMCTYFAAVGTSGFYH